MLIRSQKGFDHRSNQYGSMLRTEAGWRLLTASVPPSDHETNMSNSCADRRGIRHHTPSLKCMSQDTSCRGERKSRTGFVGVLEDLAYKGLWKGKHHQKRICI